LEIVAYPVVIVCCHLWQLLAVCLLLSSLIVI
jgi:hypothetical protein